MTTVSRYISPFPENLLRAMGTLTRLRNLDELLVDEEKRRPTIIPKYIEKVREVETSCLNFPTWEVFQRALDAFDPQIVDLYPLDIEARGAEVVRCVRRMVKDAGSLLSAPAKKSAVGDEGPTFLISYPRGADKIKGYVAKRTDWNELCTHLIYQQFGTFFDHPTEGAGFLAPRTMGFDFFRARERFADGTLREGNPEEMGRLKQHAEGILQTVFSPEQQLMVSDRIWGETLFDFAYTKYPYLEDWQKEKLFSRLARLAMFDVVVGAPDRFIRIEKWPGSEGFSLERLPARLSNVMLVWQPEMESPPTVYAIDNTMRQSLIDNPLEREQYESFLRQLCSDRKEMVLRLKDCMLESLASALRTEIDDVDGNIQEIKLKLTEFSRDLETIAPPAIEEGLQQMIDYLQYRLIPDWNWSAKGKELQEKISSAFPELYASLQRRFHILPIFTEVFHES